MLLLESSPVLVSVPYIIVDIGFLPLYAPFSLFIFLTFRFIQFCTSEDSCRLCSSAAVDCIGFSRIGIPNSGWPRISTRFTCHMLMIFTNPLQPGWSTYGSTGWCYTNFNDRVKLNEQCFASAVSLLWRVLLMFGIELLLCLLFGRYLPRENFYLLLSSWFVIKAKEFFFSSSFWKFKKRVLIF